jgi:hypothetical protein
MITKEQEEIFEWIRMSLGAPIVPVQLTDDQLCSLMTFVVKEYQKHMQQFLILQNWTQLYGKKLVNLNEMAWSITMRNFDYTKQFSYFFSKEVGLQQQGPWELKKDYIVIEKGKQDYIVPAGRTINSVLFITPNTTDPALWAGMGGFGGAQLGYGSTGVGGGMAGWGSFGAGGPGFSGFYSLPAYDISLLSADLNYKQKLLGGELVYKVTAGPNGTHIIHLLSTPGSKFSFNHMPGTTGMFGGIGCYVWYTYYDTEKNSDECAKNNTDVLLTPDQFPISVQSFEFMNQQAKQTIQNLLLAKAKMTLGYIRGYASGEVTIPNATMKLDYNMLIQDGRDEWKYELDIFTKWLEMLHPHNQLKYQKDMIDSMYDILGAIPNKIYVF